jgi:hypothetical protein
MIQLAGIALGRFAYDADFVITRVNKQVDHDPDPNFLPPTHHKIVDGHTVDDIVNIFHNTVGFDARLDSNGFTVSFPLRASREQSTAFRDAIVGAGHASNHFGAWFATYTKNAPNSEEIFHLLFVDLTPGQITSLVVINGRIKNQRLAPRYTDNSTRLRMSECPDSSNIDELYDRLVGSIVPREINLHLVCILRPEGSFPDLSNTDLESKFPGIPVQWVTLDDISYGAALQMNRESVTSSTTMLSSLQGIDTRQRTLGITLADGNIVTILPELRTVPSKWKFMFTTCRDNQTTTTIRLWRGTKFCAQVTLKGLKPKLRGQTMIKVTLDTSSLGETTLSTEEFGTGLKITNALGMALQLYTPDMDIDATQISKENTGEQVEMTLGRDGIIGELPE